MAIGDHSLVTIIAAAVAVFLIGRYVINSITTERKIRALGGRAPIVPSWVPGGLGFVSKVFRKAWKHESLDFWQTLMRDHGNPAHPCTVEMAILNERLVFTVDEENIKAILATQFSDYGKGEEFHRVWYDFLGDSIFTTDGEMWHNSRQLIRPQFIKDRVADLHVFEKHVQALLPLLGGERPGAPVEVVDLFLKFTLDAATHFLLGNSVNSLESGEHGFADAFAHVQHTQGLIAKAGPLHRLVPRKSFFEGLKVMDNFMQPFIDQTLRLSPEELEKKSKSDEGYTFLHALANFTRDPKVLRDQLTGVLLAGRDTTAMTLSWLFYELSRRPEIVIKLRKEVEAHVGTDRLPTYADLKSMRYLQHTINETLRLYPIVPFNVRIALKDTTLPRGGGVDGKQQIGVLAGTPIGYSTLAMQHRAELYPPVSEKFAHYLEFSPERWESWIPKPWTYIPFNAGARLCIGQQFALTEVAYTAVRILQTYSRVENAMTKAPGLKADIVLQPSDGVDVVFLQ